MSIRESFSNIFGTSVAPGAAPVATVTPVVVEPVAPVSPLDKFTSLWEPATVQGVDGTLPANIFAGAEQGKMLEAARKVDFAKSIPPAILAKITSGGPEAAQAFAQALNDVSQRAYAQSSFASTKIVEAALAKFQEGIDSRLPGQIKKHSVSETIRQNNPTLQHPAMAPIMEAMQSQLTVKYPTASVAEINDMATQYISAMQGAMAPPKPADQVSASEDWGKFFA